MSDDQVEEFISYMNRWFDELEAQFENIALQDSIDKLNTRLNFFMKEDAI